jgi:hypothetical protein
MCGRAELPKEFFELLESRKTYIAHGEALAVLFALTHLGQLIAKSSIVLYVDNIGVLSCICKGSSRTAEVDSICNAICLAVVEARADLWSEHVESAANPSDGGTRGSEEDALALGFSGIPMRPLPMWSLTQLLT